MTHLPDIFDFKDDLSREFPRLVMVVAGRPCDAFCPHCFSVAESKFFRNPQRRQFISPEHYEIIAKQCSEYKYHTKIRITSYGEPFLHPQLLDLMEYSSSIGVRTSVLTHGNLLTSEISERLVNFDLEAIEISVEACNRDLYKRIKVGLDFDKMLNNVRQLIEIRNRLNGKLFIMVSIVDQPNWNPPEEIEKSVKFWEEVGVDHISVRTYLTWGIAKLRNRQDPGEGYLSEDTSCPYPYERLQIDPDGFIRLCNYDIRELIPPFGHMEKHRISDVWQGKVNEPGFMSFNSIRPCHQRNGVFNKKLAEDQAPLCAGCEDRIKRSWTFNYRDKIDQEIREFQEKQNKK